MFNINQKTGYKNTQIHQAKVTLVWLEGKFSNQIL